MTDKRDTDEFEIDLSEDVDRVDVADLDSLDVEPPKQADLAKASAMPDPADVADEIDGKLPWELDIDENSSGDEIAVDDEDADNDDVTDDDDLDDDDDDIEAATPSVSDADLRAAQAVVESRKDVVRYQAQAQLDAYRQQRDSLQVTARALSYEMDAARQRLIQAKEEGTAQEELDAQERYQQARAAVENAQRVYSEIPSDDDVIAQANEALQAWDAELEKFTSQARQSAPAKVTAGNKLAERWMARNPDITKDQRKMQLVAQLDAQLSKEGKDPNSAAYFKEMNKRLAAQGITAKSVGGKKRAYGAPVGSVKGSGRASASAGSNKVKLGPSDFALMERFGLDPKNKAHLHQFAKSRRERLASQG
jgi:hypothetical protein